MDHVNLLFAISIGLIAVGTSAGFLGLALDYDLDYFKYANNVTSMQQEIKDDIQSKETIISFFQFMGLTAAIIGVIMLFVSLKFWKQVVEKQDT